ncbi:MAG TPA: 50S ribosomal protein L11 methyltransferase [Burkholderiales bacterium]|nr:50S ribosomal protein L11 methyltransferase [Burkholderiales bacterium]
MNWLSLTLEANAEQAEILSESLLQLGALSVDISDARAGTPDEQPVFGEPGESSPTLWQSSRVNGLFPAGVDIAAIVKTASLTAHLVHPKFTVADAPDRDWVRLVRLQFAPMQISPRLWVVPTWHAAPDAHALNLILDPGLGFGTGSHPTTRMCLNWLDAHLKGGEQVLDYGCGSGILALAAKRLGAQRAVGVDCDAQALDSSRANARQNKVDAEFYTPNELPPFEADVVLANILANPLKLLAPLLAQATRRGGAIVLSGILRGQACEVEEAYLQWFGMRKTDEDSGWVCLAGTKR